MNAVDRFFKLQEQGTTIRQEIIAGAATFLTMAYIIVVNPLILSDAGMDFGAVFTATILAAAIGTGVMGLWANWPVALAPGMGMNAFFTYGVVLGMGHQWQAALGAVFCSGVLFMALSASGLRQWILEAMPKSLRLGIGAGIGLFLALIGLRNAGIVVGHPDTLVTIGDLTQSTVLLACVGFVGMTLLDARRITGAIVISIIGITVIGLVVGDASWGGGTWLPPSPAPTLFALDIAAVVELGLIVVVLTFLFFDFFDTAGTLTSVAVVAGRVRDDGSIENIGRAVFADSVATTAGSLIGTSSTTSYIESGAGIREGGRTGLTAVTCAVLFLLCLFLAPLVKTIPSWAAASALVFVGTGFVATLKDLDWEDTGAYVPAVLTAIVMPFTFSIANGIAIGFISYAVINTVTRNARELHPAVWLLAAASLLYFLKDF
ncbi:MAG: NCS2 family permease [Rhodospirillales bacterium]|nr:NCS2 family permease [Rhodospirillales bacterium]